MKKSIITLLLACGAFAGNLNAATYSYTSKSSDWFARDAPWKLVVQQPEDNPFLWHEWPKKNVIRVGTKKMPENMDTRVLDTVIRVYAGASWSVPSSTPDEYITKAVVKYSGLIGVDYAPPMTISVTDADGKETQLKELAVPSRWAKEGYPGYVITELEIPAALKAKTITLYVNDLRSPNYGRKDPPFDNYYLWKEGDAQVSSVDITTAK